MRIFFLIFIFILGIWGCKGSSNDLPDCDENYELVNEGSGMKCLSKIQITLQWDPTIDSTGYRLYFGSSSGTYDGNCTDSNLTSPVEILVEDLENHDNPVYIVERMKNSFCYFAVTAFNESGESGYSGEIIFDPSLFFLKQE
ncbi:hypothetical protein ACFL20_08810 [Spirochaetota bacterium]